MSTTETVPLSNVDQLRDKILSLRERLTTASPGWESHLHSIHKQLAEDESLSHMLTDEEVGIIVAGLSKRKGVVIAEQTKRSTSKKKISLEDL